MIWKWSGQSREHIKIHSGDRPYICTYCKAAFKQSSVLKVHLKTHAEKCDTSVQKKLFPCDLCSRVLSTAYSLSQHKKTHTGQKTHQCEQCGRGFGNSSHLKIHRMTHSGERPYACSEEGCSAAFTTSTQVTECFNHCFLLSVGLVRI